MKKYLFIANSSKPTKKLYESKEKIYLNSFCIASIKAALSKGYQVYMGVNRKYAEELECDYPVKFYNSNTYRSLFNFIDNIKAYKSLSRFLDKEKIDVIHCNTPIGGLIGRLVGHRKRVSHIIYTVHGFHFFKGNSRIKNFIFKNVERYLSRKTDTLITINHEDYEVANTFKLKKNGKAYKIKGVGIDIKSFQTNRDSTYIRDILNLDKETVITITTGDLIKRKNLSSLIDIFKQLKDKKIHLVICGEGPELIKLRKKIKKFGLLDNIHLMGFRSDIKDLLASSDIFLFPSTQEGLPRSLMEAMATGLPSIVSSIRGNVDLISNGENGILCANNDLQCYVDNIEELSKSKNIRTRLGNNAKVFISKYDYEDVTKQITKIFEDNI